MESALRSRPETSPLGFYFGNENSGFFFSLCTIAPSPQRKLSSRSWEGAVHRRSDQGPGLVSRARGKLTRKGKKYKTTTKQQQQQQNKGPLVSTCLLLTRVPPPERCAHVWTNGTGYTQFFSFFCVGALPPFISPIRLDFTCVLYWIGNKIS